jgi:signal transduction histidine kinase
MSALIAHDLSGPLHAAKFCAAELRNNLDSLANEKRNSAAFKVEFFNSPKLEAYIHRIDENLKRAMDLIFSLRARLKNPAKEVQEVSFLDAHQHVLKLLQIQFLPSKFNNIKFDVAPAVNCLKILVPSVDLIHILDNLYRNSITNLSDKAILHPKIKIYLTSIHESRVNIVIQDNGSGLTALRFQELTAFRFKTGIQPPPLSEGLGLRLTRRLVELNQGELKVVDIPTEQGTAFHLSLKVGPEERIVCEN